eukprot:3117660-Rhodomonas_salina.2
MGNPLQLCNPVLSAASEISEELCEGLLSMLNAPLDVSLGDLSLVSKAPGSQAASVSNWLFNVTEILSTWYGSDQVKDVEPLVGPSMVLRKSVRDSVFRTLVEILDIDQESSLDVW